MSRSRILALATATGLSALAGPVVAEQQGAYKLEDILVTAQKKEQSIQDVPMSISAFGAAAIERNGLRDLNDYGTRVPNLSFGATAESRSASQLAIAIRGVVGTGTTGFYVDDVPVPASINPQVMDLERIEVLRGPQGTLYGARSMGGTVRLITRQPELNDTSGSIRARVSATTGGDLGYRADGLVNVAVTPDRFALRMLAYGMDEGGFLDRAASPAAPVQFPTHRNIDDSRTYGGRIAGLLSFRNGDVTVLPAFQAERREFDGRSYADVDARNRTNLRAFDIDEPGWTEWKLASLTIRYAAPYGEFTSATSYFDLSGKDTEDASEFLSTVFCQFIGMCNDPGDMLPGPLDAYDDVEAFAQEVRFSSRFAGPFNFTAGAFYQDSDKGVTFPPGPFPFPSSTPIVPNVFSLNQTQQVKELALFAEVTADVTEDLALIAGARYFDNQYDFSSIQGGVFGAPFPLTGESSESGVTPKFGLQYQFSEDRMLYATAAQGFRIGGVNMFPADVCAEDLANLGLTASELGNYDSDTLWSYEAGLRSSWPESRVVFNVAGYYIDWEDVQQTIGLSCGFPAMVNAGQGRIQGFEADLSWAAAAGLVVNLGVGYADSEITDNGGVQAVAEGTPVQNAPKWTGSAAIDYDLQAGNLPVYLHADYAYVGQSVNARNSAPFFRTRPSYSIVNLRAGVTLGEWEVGLFVENATDENANLADVPPMAAELWDRPRIRVNRPRTIGMEVRAKF